MAGRNLLSVWGQEAASYCFVFNTKTFFTLQLFTAWTFWVDCYFESHYYEWGKILKSIIL